MEVFNNKPLSSKKEVSYKRSNKSAPNLENSTSAGKTKAAKQKKLGQTRSVRPSVYTPPTVLQESLILRSEDSPSPFAAAKFSYTPHPHKLPKPPVHWYHTERSHRTWPADSDSSQSSQNSSESSQS